MTPIWTPLAASWVASRLPAGAAEFGACKALGVFDAHSRIVAGVVFHGWNEVRGIVEVSAAAEDRRWLTRGVARTVFGYAFDYARVVVAHCSERNTAVRRIWAACGAHEAVSPELWGPGEAAVILTVTPDAWLASKLGRRHG